MSAAAAAGVAWLSANLPGYWAYRRALADPAATQARLLRGYLNANADTAFGRAHGFDRIRDAAGFRERVPLLDWVDHAPWIARVRRGEGAVLTRERVRRLETTGGSTARKLVPYTATLQAELRRAVAPWIVDLCRRRPSLALGRSYWAISPVVQAEAADEGGPPVGFEDDAAYLGGAFRRLVDATLAVPSAVRFSPDIETFRYATLLFLLRARDLRLVSVWHPSFLTLLLDALPPHWDALLADIRDGGMRGPAPFAPTARAALRRCLGPLRRRADELRRLGPDEPTRLWPRLGLVSCWGDGHAALHLPEVERALPGVPIQAKGLLATEACVTIPFEGATPLAIRSHFFEFLEDGGRPRLAHELEPGGAYSVVVTTGGGLYRYRLGDRVVCSGLVGRTPAVRFVGKAGHVSDLVGEKLREDFVAEALAAVLGRAGQAGLAFLAPDAACGRPCYTLHVQAQELPGGLAASLDAALAGNGDYAYARALGQLAPARVFRISGGGLEAYLRRCGDRGQRLGDVKPLALSLEDKWSEALDGVYEEAGVERAAAIGR